MRLHRLKPLTILSFFAFAEIVSAQGTSTQSLPTITIETGEAQTRKLRPRQNARQRKLRFFAEESFTEIEIAKPTVDAYDQMSFIPGVTTRSQGTTAPAISIRGSVKSDRVLTLYNELPLNTADGLGARRLLLPKEILRPVRIYKGPMSTRFGGSAMGGAVAFSNKFLKTAEISVHGESGIRGGGTAIIPLLAERNYRFQASAHVDRSTGEFDFTNTHKSGNPAEFRNNNDNFLQRYTLHGQQRLGAWKLKQSLVIANEHGTTPGSVLAPQVTEFSTLGGLGSLHIGRKISRNFLFESQSSFLVTDSEFDNIGNDLPDSSLYNQKFHQRLATRVKLARDWQVSAGIDYSDNTVDSLAGSEDTKTDSQTDLYVFNKVFLTRAWSIDVGARHLIDFETNVFSAEIAHEARDQKVWLSYRQGYRSPSLSDRFASFPSFQGNPSLEPESSQQVEAGYRLEQNNDYEIQGSAFAIFYENFISNQNLDANRITLVNQGTARSLGIDVAYKQFYGSWAFGLSGTFMNTYNEETDNSIVLTPDAEALATIAYRVGPMIITGLQTLWSQSLDTDANGNDVVLSEGYRTDIEITAQFPKWSLTASVENIFDNPRESKFGFPEPQRSFKLGMRYLF